MSFNTIPPPAPSTGSVTSVSVVTANGLAGTVATATTTPAITLSTSVTGVLKGNGTAISAATPATDYVAPGAITTDGITMATARVLGRTTASTGAVEEITVGTGLTLSAGTLTATGSGGTVTTVSVVSANGFAGTVATATTTPAITISTSVTGVLKGNGTAISAASAGTDYVAPGAITSDGITMATARILGRTTATTGAVEEITVGTGLSLSAGSLTATGGGTVTTTGSPASGNLTKFSGASSITNGDLSGDVTTTGTLATTIANSAVTYAKIQDVTSASRLLGRGSASGSGVVQEITVGTNLTMTGTVISATGPAGSAAFGLIQMIRQTNYSM